MNSSSKPIIDYLIYLWPFRKTKWGLIATYIPIILFWIYNILPKYFINKQIFYTYSAVVLIIFLGIFIYWLFYSGRVIATKQPFTVIFCLKPTDSVSAQYINNSIKVFLRELDNLKLPQRIHIKQIGQDIINNNEEAHKYRQKKDVDLIIWGEIFSGSKSEKDVCDFKDIFFTYKVPGNIGLANLTDLFKNDINIAVIKRDWNIYKINSLPDTEKISAHFSEIILFILGLIYAQHGEFVEDSAAILELFFNLLEKKTKNEKILIDEVNDASQISPEMLRKGRVLFILLHLFKNLGLYFIEQREFQKGLFYLDKFIKYGKKKDVDILSSAALAYFYLKDISKAKQYTDEINNLEKDHQLYILNKAFFGIYEENYGSALFFYKEIIKRGKNVDKTIIIKVISFLDERKSDHPKEIGYDFAIGILNLFHFQKQNGERELRQFAKLARNKEKYREMVTFIESHILSRKKRKRK
ncbi:MAG: hypothetical protein QUS13_12220 [Smithella sp.]|nr:hypothetical protein [Smithella sp.]